HPERLRRRPKDLNENTITQSSEANNETHRTRTRNDHSHSSCLRTNARDPGGDRDYNRLRSLFAKDARLTSVTKEASDHPARLLTVDEYINLAGGYFKTHAFYEQAIVNKVDRFGNMAQVFSSYESRNAPNEKPFTRGINSIQLFYDQNRWWVLSILWDEESPTNPLPANLATRSTAPVTQ